MRITFLSGRRLALTIDTFCLIIGGPAGCIWTNYREEN